ncbi:FUSC family protein [Flavisolibacter sp. BT320]|nr:FUSC family protein [Flavisolibacter longurius]
MTNQTLKEVQYFFYSQAFADGLRSTVAILIPALVGSYLGYFQTGLTISLGAMVVSLTDSPGPILNKRNGMLIAMSLAFITAILTAFARTSPLLMGIEVLLVTFFFSMFVVYGQRATGVGNTALLVMILTMDNPVQSGDILLHASYILAGGLFYFTLSLLLYRILPYRSAQRALGECIREVANYLSIRADFYNCNTDLETDYKRMVSQQIVVNEKQDLVREVFFKTRKIVNESTDASRKLVFTFVETVDLFEDITASYYDYKSLRKIYGDSGALSLIHDTLKKLVNELHAIGIAIQTNTSFERGFDYDKEIKTLKAKIDAITLAEGINKVVLIKIVVNIRNLLGGIISIEQYFTSGIKRKRSGVDHSHFITHQPLDPKIFANNLNIQSAAFRHAIRVSAACVVGYFIIQLMPYGNHSYWVLLTIAFIIKPAFSLTKQRNIERIIGTVIGAAVGVGVLLLVENKTALFLIMVLFMLSTYTFMRLNYLAMVLSVTPYVFILFSFIGSEFRVIAWERVLDTLIGCAIAFAASYFLFPSWEREQLKNHMRDILQANMLYLQKIIKALSGHTVSTIEYKVARKEVYLHSANLSAAFQRMLSEPKSKQSSQSLMQQFVVLNHIFFSNVANIGTTLLTKDRKGYPPELLHLSKKVYKKLDEGRKKFGEAEELPLPEEEVKGETKQADDDELLKEQLQFIHQLSKDITKTAGELIGETTVKPVHIPSVQAQ